MASVSGGGTDELDAEIQRINKRKMEELMRAGAAQARNREGKPITLTDATFYSELARHPVLVVDFWAPWCGPCRMVGPIVEELAGDLAGRATFGKLNVDENPVTAERFQVRSIPTILIFKGGRPVDGVIGALPKSALESKIRPYLDGQGAGGTQLYR